MRPATGLIAGGVLLLGLGLALDDWAGIYGEWLADRANSSGEIKIAGLKEAQVQAVFDAIRTKRGFDAQLVLENADAVRLSYEIRLIAPDKRTAVAQTEALLNLLGDGCRAQGGQILWSSALGYARAELGPETAARLRIVKRGVPILGLVLLAAGLAIQMRRRVLLGKRG